jgi:serine/threonine protein kinase/WD40 repeat protein
VITERDLFIAALNQEDSAGREAYLQEACGPDTALRKRVEALLQAHDNAGTFLESPADCPTAAIASSCGTSEGPGSVIGPYKIQQQIGEGGMGTVYMAEQTQPVRRTVALKLIKAGMDSRQVLSRFGAERQALALMDHPNIARVLDAGSTATGRPYFVMELVKGIPITRFCDERRLTTRERLEIAIPVCQAVQHAHQKGIIHRDLKPSNVLIALYDGKPVPKIIDFGVAKATGPQLTDQTLYTEFGAVVGTLEYMSPEQAELSQLDIDTRSDIYSLGVLLYELMTGSTPMDRKRLKRGALLEMLRVIREDESPRPSLRLSTSTELPSIAACRSIGPHKLGGLLRGEIDWIVMKALEKNRDRRYETANALAMDLRRYLDDEPVRACPPSAGYRFRKFTRRHRGLLTTAGLIALALILGTAASTWQAIRATKAEGRANLNYQTAEEQGRKASAQLRLTQQARKQGLHRLYESRLSQAKAGSLSRRAGQRFDSLDAVAAATALARELKLLAGEDLRLRNVAIACLGLTDLRLAKLWDGRPAGSTYSDFDGNFEHYARGSTEGSISIRRVSDDVEIARLPSIGGPSFPLLSRDGRFIELYTSERVQVWSLVGPEPVLVFDPSPERVVGMNFSPDSRKCVVQGANGVVTVVNLVSRQPLRRLSQPIPGQGIVISPSEHQFAVSRDNAAEVRDFMSGRLDVSLPHPAKVYELAWHPNGTTLAVACGGTRVFLWDTTTGKQLFVLEGFKNGGIQVAFSHNGNLLATTSWEGKLRLWDSRTGLQLFSTMEAGQEPPRFRADDRYLSASSRDGKLGYWELAEGKEYRTLVHTSASTTDPYFNPSVSGDGRLLAVGVHGGVGIWELSSGRELQFLDLPGINFTAFEPSGALLTNCTTGLFRWQVTEEPAAPGHLVIGPPRRLSIPGSIYDIACSRDGRVIASAQSSGGMVLHAARPDQPVKLTPHEDVRYVSVSPDGKLAVTGSHTFADAKIWDSDSGALVKVLPGAHWRATFSPDGKWLTSIGEGVLTWKVDSWQEGRRIGGGEGAAFSPDTSILAVESGEGSIRLVDPATGNEYARLEDPNQDRARYIAFSPDGTQLIATNDDSRSIHAWDLRRIRQQLSDMGLDWDLPPYPPLELKDPQPIELRVELGEIGIMVQADALQRQASKLTQSGQWDAAVAAYTRSIDLDPANSKAQNDLAWLLVTCPEPKHRDPKRAISLATKAVELDPNHDAYPNTLGVALYRNAQWPAAIAALTKSMKVRSGGDGFDWFFLAMAHWQLNRKEEARRWFYQADAWRKTHQPQDEELLRFRAEAMELLGGNAAKPPAAKGASPSPR